MLIVGQSGRIARDPDFITYEELPKAFNGYALLAVRNNRAVILAAYKDLQTVLNAIDQIVNAELAGLDHFSL